jgi:diguanylate cyclase (GGDEF)-like protein
MLTAARRDFATSAKILALVGGALVPVALAAAYFLAALVNLRLAAGPAAAIPIWAPAGIGIATFVIAGNRAWTALLVASFAAHAFTSASWMAAAVLAIGSTLQAAAAASLIHRYAGGRDVFRHPHDVLRFTTLIAPTIAMASATCVVLLGAIWPAGPAADESTQWIGSSLSQLTGMLVVTPFVVLWSVGPWRRSWKQLAEAVMLLLLFVPVCLAVFANLLPFHDQHYPLEILCVPFLMWAAFRLGRRESATVVAVLAIMAGVATSWEHGPFVRDTRSESFMLLQIHVCIWAVMSLSLAAVVSEHAHAERLAKTQAVTDPLTGLANFRQLAGQLDAEIARSQRTRRPFALVFVDVDGLKQINDTWGHLAGNEALCRVAGVLRQTCRAVDTPARFGGDEFVIVLPETDAAEAEGAAQRIASRIAADSADQPPLSVTTGVASYPDDGASSALLLGMADRALYRSKERRQALTPAGA